MTARKVQARPPRERDLLELRTQQHRRNEQVAHALVTILCRADAQTLAALGVILRFVVHWTGGRGERTRA